MQTEIVPVRVDYGRLILEWVIVALVAFAVAVVILFTRAGVKPGMPPIDLSAGIVSSSAKLSQNASLSKGNKKISPAEAAAQIASQLGRAQFSSAPQLPDETGMHLYLLACFLLGVAVLVLECLYPPWLGVPQDDLARQAAERLTLVPAGYGWLWHSHRLRDKQAKK